VSGDAGEDRRVVTAEEGSDLGEAEVPLEVVAKAPPDLVPGVRDAARSLSAADLDGEHPAAAADVLDEREEAASAELAEDLGGVLHREDYAPGEGVRREGPSMRRVWQRWRRRLSRAPTISFLPRKVYQSS